MARTEEIVKVSRNYQITIPSKIRQKFKITEGELVKVVYDDNENVVKIEPVRELWKGQ
ncbi:AbrB family transcriptional regulator [Sulfodiicoccus acidiphilus]|uniref:AbrB family transcriptional regulator n=1 Tax=Sulfodiicoccus acidiphilus TaxID=1670455 RepID=A0A348B0L6_9CREN|nr:AbrB/MazE/SpoVT family DNA-binding domain-containing protein [Sulfodiicoccus acidiphilus]BBD71718.1 AbrB family transcriptional regulator [Sulfodiicoccus acidiphilus]GGT86376.1 AbrB family transcriptional regulator [Sulfodiicoccus acidiphilus]